MYAYMTVERYSLYASASGCSLCPVIGHVDTTNYYAKTLNSFTGSEEKECDVNHTTSTIYRSNLFLNKAVRTGINLR